MFKKLSAFILLHFLPISVSLAQITKEDVDEHHRNSMNTLSWVLSEQCMSALSPIINKIEESHQIFLNNQPLEATLNEINLIRDILPAYKNLNCNLAEITAAMSFDYYMHYYQDNISGYEQTPVPQLPTEAEKSRLIELTNAISSKLKAVCQLVSCKDDDPAQFILEDTEMILEELQDENPFVYYDALDDISDIKMLIAQAYHEHVQSDKRYYEALNWVLLNMDDLFMIPKKYFFDLHESQDFRHSIASNYVDKFSKYNYMEDLSIRALGSYHYSLYDAARDHNIHQMLETYRYLYVALYRDLYNKTFAQAGLEQYVIDMVDQYNNEAYAHFKSYMKNAH